MPEVTDDVDIRRPDWKALRLQRFLRQLAIFPFLAAVAAILGAALAVWLRLVFEACDLAIRVWMPDVPDNALRAISDVAAVWFCFRLAACGLVANRVDNQEWTTAS